MLTTLIVHDFSDDIVPWLVNAPALRRLKLSPESISFEDINGIHDDVPGLQHLEITYGIITNDGFDDPIEPATSIVECVFLRSDTAVPKNVLEYSYRKYPNASSLTACLNTDILRTKRFDKETHSGWINLFRFMGKKLKKLCYFNEADDRDLFETLDKHDCHLNYLHLVHFKQASLQKIAQSKQILSLQTLVLLNVVTESFDWLKQLQVLQKFKLCHRGESTYTISLNDILNNCPPKLISLSLEHVDIADDLEPSTPSNIKHLSFYQIKLPARTDAYISHHFPGLKKLKLRGFSIDQRKFDVSTFDLHVLHITCSHDDYFTKVMISTLKNREQRLYQFKDRGDAEIDPNLKTLLPQALSYPSHEIDVSPDFTLVCHSLGKFISV
jgi:hypothetical protein